MPGILFRNGRVLYDVRTGKILWGEPEDACCCDYYTCPPGCNEIYDYTQDESINRGLVWWECRPVQNGFFVPWRTWYQPGLPNSPVSTPPYILESMPFWISDGPPGSIPPTYQMGSIRVRVNHPKILCPDDLPISVSITIHFDAAAEYANLFAPPRSTRFGSTYKPLDATFSDGAGGSPITILDYDFTEQLFTWTRTNFLSNNWSFSMYMRGVGLMAQVSGRIEFLQCGV